MIILSLFRAPVKLGINLCMESNTRSYQLLDVMGLFTCHKRRLVNGRKCSSVGIAAEYQNQLVIIHHYMTEKVMR